MHYLFLGDSITCSDRFWDDTHEGLGDGYVYQLYKQKALCQKETFMTNKGFDGLTCASLLERLCSSRITLSDYDQIILLIGINDVGVSMNTGRSLSEQHFMQNYKELICLLQTHTQNLLCLSPFLFPYPQEYLSWKEELSFAIRCMKQVCDSFSIPFYSLQDYMDSLLLKEDITAITPDGIHLTQRGHSLLASYILPYLI